MAGTGWQLLHTMAGSVKRCIRCIDFASALDRLRQRLAGLSTGHSVHSKSEDHTSSKPLCLLQIVILAHILMALANATWQSYFHFTSSAMAC